MVITLSRINGGSKIRFASRAVWTFRSKTGYYERVVPVEDVAEAFAGSPRMRVRVDTETLVHTVLVSKNAGTRIEYRVEFS
jgi:hypothetical protein